MAVKTSHDVVAVTAGPGTEAVDAAGAGDRLPELTPAAPASGGPPGPSEAQPGDRFGQLDSLRGIAAATVVVGHLIRSVPAIDDRSQAFWALKYTPLHVFWAGHQAVIFFFVLSGFVLALPFYSRAVSYRTFVVKRVLRICVPYWSTVVLGSRGSHCSGGAPGCSWLCWPTPTPYGSCPRRPSCT
jgi:acyltransferase-like protein